MEIKIKSVLKRLVKDFTLSFLYPLIYRKHASAPVERGLVVFYETKELEMPGSFDLLWKRLKADPSKKVEYITLAQNHTSRIGYYVNGAKCLKRLAVAEVIFLDDASDLVSCLPMRSETKAVQLWHACGAFKKWGMSTADLKFGGTRESIRRHPFYGNLSLVTISSPEVAWAYIEAMDLKGKEDIVQALGVSRTDVFFDPGFLLQSRKRVNEMFPQTRGKKILLYAPTFRGHVSTAAGPDELDIPAMKQALGGEWALLIKHHPFVKHPTPIPERCGDFASLVQSEVTIDELLCTADACISDYSSIVFEYSLLERPMIFFAFDIDEYNDWRGFYYRYDDFTPGPVVATTEEIIEYVKRSAMRFDSSKIKIFKDRFMSACDGHCTDRIIKYIIL